MAECAVARLDPPAQRFDPLEQLRGVELRRRIIRGAALDGSVTIHAPLIRPSGTFSPRSTRWEKATRRGRRFIEGDARFDEGRRLLL
jgi:hypothetical protein